MPNSRIDSVSRTYAGALFELARSKGDDILIDEQVQELGEIIDKEPMLLRLISTPALSSSKRRQVIQKIFKGKVDQTIYKFLQVLSDKNRLASLPGIIKSYGE